MTAPERIGIPDGASKQRRVGSCPGAALVVTRDDFAQARREGLIWSSGVHDLPADGKGHARVFCQDEIEIVKRPHGEYAMGLCRRCSELEANQRSDLRARAAKGSQR